MRTGGIQIRDPFILKAEGRYYLFGSTDRDIWNGPGAGFDTYTSRDLLEWEGPVEAFRPPAGFWGTKNFWAPEVFAYDGAYYMFASFLGEGYKRGTAVLRAERPAGPYTPWSDGPVTPRDWMCLDGTLHIGEAGEPWLVFCHEWVQIGDGTVCAARLSRDLRAPEGEPVTLFSSSEAPWSGLARSPSNRIEGYVTDGCFLHRLANGTLLMLWSCVGAEGYCIGYARSESGMVLGPWRQAEKPLFAQDGGHGMIFRGDDGRLWLTIHTPNQTPLERAAFFALEETDDGLRRVL
ncbi:MAG: glycoside hydrolase family 43 protein [Oscillospiraceae bacterium]|nr:glycoside hydrolase family 43 protein [Oscillospiraceae bacterium]